MSLKKKLEQAYKNGMDSMIEQCKQEINHLHEQWIEALKQTPGIGPKRYKAIMQQREKLARK